MLTNPAFSPGDTINVAEGVYTGTGDQVVLFDRGAVVKGGWDHAFTRQVGRSVIDGENARIGISILYGTYPPPGVNMDHIDITRGLSTASGGIGAGIDNKGDLTFSDGAIYDNHTNKLPDQDNLGAGIRSSGMLRLTNAAVFNNDGGGIYFTGFSSSFLSIYNTSIVNNEGGGLNISGGIYGVNADIINSAILHNHAHYGAGINISDSGATITNTTIAENIADESGGGIAQRVYGHLRNAIALNNTTVVRNIAKQGGGIYNFEQSLAIVEAEDSIIIQNQAGVYPDCSPNGIWSLGYNIIGSTCGPFNDNMNDLIDMDPLLGLPGGTPAYYPLLIGSPALDAGNPDGCKDEHWQLIETDARGKPRFGRCDIGAYELNPLDFTRHQAAPSVAQPNQTVDYSIQLDNPLAAGLTGIMLTDSLPAGLAYIPGSLTATSGSASFDNGTLLWSGDLPTGSGVTIGYQAVVPSQPGQITNTAALSYAGVTWEFPAHMLVYGSQVHLPVIVIK